MALRDGNLHYAKLTHVENGQMLVRRIHRLEIQAWDGRLYVVEGRDLPDGMVVFSGKGIKNAHVLQVLVPKRALKAGLPGGPKIVSWPTRRDLVCMIAGSGMLMLVIGLIQLAVLAF